MRDVADAKPRDWGALCRWPEGRSRIHLQDTLIGCFDTPFMWWWSMRVADWINTSEGKVSSVCTEYSDMTRFAGETGDRT